MECTHCHHENIAAAAEIGAALARIETLIEETRARAYHAERLAKELGV